jgi:hypothetical protein
VPWVGQSHVRRVPSKAIDAGIINAGILAGIPSTSRRILTAPTASSAEPYGRALVAASGAGSRAGDNGTRAQCRLAYHAQRAYRCGVKEVEQLPVWLPFTTETDTFTLYPGVAPLM